VLGVVVVNYGSSALLRANLAATGPLGPSVRVVVVDNASTPAERTAVEDLAAECGWEFVALPDNRGFGVASNAGIARARELGCITFCYLNPDASVTPAVLEELRMASLAEPTAVIAPRIIDSTGRTVFAGSTLGLRDGRTGARHGTARSTGPVEDWLTGACLVISAEMVDRTGGFAEDYFLYWEDVELSHRVLAAGGSLVVRTDLVAVHDEGGTQGERRGPAKSELYYRYNCRNRLLFAARNLSRRHLLGWVLCTPMVSWEILLRGGRRQLLQSPGPLWAALRGSVAGIGIALPALLRGRPAPAGRPGMLVVHPGAELYGSDRVLLESAEALAARFDVTVVLPGPGPLADELRTRGLRVESCRMPVLRRAALRPRGALRLLADTVAGALPALRLIRQWGAAGVYVNTVTLPLWPVLARLARRPVVCHVHEAERAASRVLRHAMALAPRLAGRAIVNSRFTGEVLAEVAPRMRARSTVVLNAVRGPTVVVPARDALTDGVRLLYVGRLSPRKGPQVALAALGELRARGLAARLSLLGSVFEGYEWFEQQLRETVRAEGLGDRVEFLGFQPDVWPHLAATDVVLVPSVGEESFGNVAVEAVLAGRPLVVSTGSGLAEAAAGYAVAQAVPPDLAGGWADAVERVVADWPGFRARALTDAAVARERHAPDRYRAELVAVLTQPHRGRHHATVR
jgi:GT2 family glycosyltransferase/glycosyltransferase involved in cell wall biosynthesis